MLHTISSIDTREVPPQRRFAAREALPKSLTPAPTMRVQLMHVNHPDRKAVNAFIQAGFKKAYGAEVKISMPSVIALEKAGFKAALAMRSAADELFIEQYLVMPIEQIISAQGYQTKRKHIAEIGHLYSNSSNFTLSLLIVTAMLLHRQQFTTMVFTATEQLASLFIKFGLAPSVIADADPAKLALSSQHWGSYYETRPKVMSLQLTDVDALINNNKLFKVMSEQLIPQIDALISSAQAAA